MALDMEDEALNACEKALDINPDYNKVRERKIRLLLKVNKPREAKEEADKG
jgi:hypothetical protein